MVRRQAFDQAGLINKDFFYYNEEVELCRRINQFGWEIYLVPDAKLWHKGVQRNYHPSANVTYYKVRNFLFIFKSASCTTASKTAYLVRKYSHGRQLLHPAQVAACA